MHEAVKYLILFFLVLLYSQESKAQFSTYHKKDKVGIQYNGEVIARAKFDSVVVDDQDIATAYKKNKAFYINHEGKTICKSAKETWPFSSGMGVILNNDGEYGVVNTVGEFLYSYHECDEAKRYNNMIYFKEHNVIEFRTTKRTYHYTSNELITENGPIGWIDTLYFYEGLIQVKFEKPMKYNSKHAIYDTRLAVKLDENYSRMGVYDTLGYKLFSKKQTTSLYDPSTTKIIADLRQLTFIDSNFFYGKRDKSTTLFERQDLLDVFTGNYRQILKKDKVFHAQIEQTDSDIAIYSLAGDSLTTVKMLHEMEGRYIFQSDSGVYIGLETGEALSDYYLAIHDEAGDNLRMVTIGKEYGFINDKSYELLPFKYPIIFRKIKPPERSSPGLFESLFTAFLGLVTFPIAFVSPETYFSILGINDDHYDPKKLELVAPREAVFQEGYLPVCLNDYPDNDTSLVYEANEVMYYNYIDTAGNLFNKTKYYQCLPFQNGKAWVKTKEGMILVDKNGKRVGKEIYDFVEVDNNGYYTVMKYYYSGGLFSSSKRLKYGLISPEHEVIFDCNYKNIIKRYTSYEADRHVRTGETKHYHIPKE